MHYWYGQASIVMTIISGNNIIIIESFNVRCCWSCKPCNSSCWTCRSGRHFENTISVFSVPLSWCSDAKSEIFLQLLNGEGEALRWNFIEPAHPCCVGEGQGNLFPPSRSSDATIWKKRWHICICGGLKRNGTDWNQKHPYSKRIWEMEDRSLHPDSTISSVGTNYTKYPVWIRPIFLKFSFQENIWSFKEKKNREGKVRKYIVGDRIEQK